ncbi:hypothetical protein EVAR_67354_1 [Eumeta japonica]|uniref:Uncharacterized protein n=1 Tax=Eumeta variegata TaxID=151549 RepID=A0A4C2A9Z5_EUMVA|nr:hypothetical protein EVAR_67354_1 [Eumeta japonica]
MESEKNGNREQDRNQVRERNNDREHDWKRYRSIHKMEDFVLYPHGCSRERKLVNTGESALQLPKVADLDVHQCPIVQRFYLKEKDDIETFLKFMELRPPELCLWGVVPVDMRLPVGLLSLVTTYLIVIAQFDHLFD